MRFIGPPSPEPSDITKLSKGQTVTVAEGEYGISDVGPTEEQFLAFCRGVLDDGGPRSVVVKFMKTKEQFASVWGD